MNNAFIFLLMIFCHIVDDYYLQGWLASAKQKRYWEENAPDKMYKHDYIWALIMHSFSWTFMIMLPVAFLMNFNIKFDFAMLFVWKLPARHSGQQPTKVQVCKVTFRVP